jgi:hypothetical protein
VLNTSNSLYQPAYIAANKVAKDNQYQQQYHPNQYINNQYIAKGSNQHNKKDELNISHLNQ